MLIETLKINDKDYSIENFTSEQNDIIADLYRFLLTNHDNEFVQPYLDLDKIEEKYGQQDVIDAMRSII